MRTITTFTPQCGTNRPRPVDPHGEACYLLGDAGLARSRRGSPTGFHYSARPFSSLPALPSLPGKQVSIMTGASSSSWLRYAGLGLELVGTVGGLTLIGWLIDGQAGTAPWGVLCGALLGVVVGMANLVRRALKSRDD